MIELNSNKKILTITLNPSLDRTLVTHYLHLGYHNFTTEQSRLDPAGTGLDISRALHKLECETHAIVLLGNDPTGRAYQLLLQEEVFPTSVISVDGQTRSNIIILDTGAKQETQITESADNILRQDIHLVVDLLKENLSVGDIVVLAGHLPNGLATDVYRWLTAEARNLRAEVILAAAGEPLKKALTAKPDLVIVKKQELESYFNIPVRDYSDVLECANRLKEEGALKVLVNIPDEGKALLVSQESHNLVNFKETVHGHSLPSTTSGIFEAFIAGYLMGKFQSESLPESLEFSAAAAMYTAAQVGHEFGEQDEVEEYLPEVNVEDDTQRNPDSD